MADEDFKPNDLIESTIQEGVDTGLKGTHTCLPGLVEIFDPATQLADIQPTIKIKQNGELKNMAILSGVPVRFFKSNKFTFAFPLEKGDEVSLYFVERSIDTWLTHGGIQNPFDVRKHDLSDAYAVPVLYSQKKAIASFPTTNLEIRANSGSAKIEVTPGTDLIFNSGSDFAVQFSALQTAFDELKAKFNSHVHPGVTSGGASTGATATPSVADISLSKIDSIKVP